MAMQGLSVVPLFAGYDLDRQLGRIFSYDVTGGCYEEHDHHSVGSGSLFARGALKKLWRPGLTADAGRRVVASRRSTTPPTTTRPPVVPTWAGGSGRPSPSSTSRVCGSSPTTSCATVVEAVIAAPPGQPGRCAMSSMPFYVSPEQLMKDRADYARKGIARGRSVVVLGYDKGIAFVAENPSRALHKVSEIYDRIAFAAVGKYNEFENLRVAGVRYADLRGYSYDRTDVTARGLANAYAQTLGTVFTQESKPYEVEIVVAEVGRDRRRRPDLPADLRRLGRRRARASSPWAAPAEPIETALKERWSPG